MPTLDSRLLRLVHLLLLPVHIYAVQTIRFPITNWSKYFGEFVVDWSENENFITVQMHDVT